MKSTVSKDTNSFRRHWLYQRSIFTKIILPVCLTKVVLEFLEIKRDKNYWDELLGRGLPIPCLGMLQFVHTKSNSAMLNQVKKLLFISNYFVNSILESDELEKNGYWQRTFHKRNTKVSNTKILCRVGDILYTTYPKHKYRTFGKWRRTHQQFW